MSCHADRKRRQRAAARQLRARDCVVDVTEIDAAAEPTNAPALDVVLDAAGVPPTIAADCAEFGLTTRYSQPQGAFWHALLIV
jgi:threonine dehydrogenase-like Zn-dependent dehydrogenase